MSVENLTWFDDRESDSFEHSVEISLDHGELRNVLNWCTTSFNNSWAWEPTNETALFLAKNLYTFYFDNEKDASVFSLRWTN